MWQYIPSSLREWPHWCIAGNDKSPWVWNGSKMVRVDVTRGPFHTFADAVSIAAHYRRPIGFVLTDRDPFVCIDLDIKDAVSKGKHDSSKWTSLQDLEMYERMLTAFKSYSELSYSGKGLHIMTTGYQGAGKRRGGVELYARGRFIIFTGRAVTRIKYAIQDSVVTIIDGEKGAYPIIDNAQYLSVLSAQMGGESERHSLIEVAATHDDSVIMRMAETAGNGDKFKMLMRGEWQTGEYPTQSEADLALMSIFAFYSQSNDQCRRLFRASALGQRDKSQRNDKYLNRTLSLIRARQQRDQVDTTAARELVMRETEKAEQDELAGLDWPPGLVGELARQIYAGSPRPVKEVAITGALGFFAGLLGKAYHIPQSGLNMYIILLALSGVGKESMHTGLSLLMNALREVGCFRIGDFLTFENWASGQSLQKHCAKSSSFVSAVGEFGRHFAKMCGDRQNPAMESLRTVITNLYQKSGPGSIAGGISYSDSDKNVSSINGVAFSLIGESTPATIYETMTPDIMADGFLSRFCLIEYRGKRPRLNKCPSGGKVYSSDLLSRIKMIYEIVLKNIDQMTSTLVQFSPEAESMMDAYGERMDDNINDSDEEMYRQLWNRAHLKALRLAAMLASADNPDNPVVNVTHARYAIDFVDYGIDIINTRIKSGEVGIDDDSRSMAMLSMLKEYINLKKEIKSSYKIRLEMRAKGLITRRYINLRLTKLSAFYKHKNQSTWAINDTLRTLVEGGYIKKITDPEKAGDIYQILDI